VTVGLLSFGLMLPMALTSNAAAMRRLGRGWKRLHRAIYAIALLACVHFFLHRAGKSNFIDPAIASAVVLILLGSRIYFRR
jgi:sulfoxide reductase heme-binding subunit YedZ